MSKIDKLLAEEAEAAERYDDSQPLPEHVKVSQPNKHRSKVFSVRLSSDEMAELEQAAEAANLPARTLARAWILDRLYGGSTPVAQQAQHDDLEHRVEHLEQLAGVARQ